MRILGWSTAGEQVLELITLTNECVVFPTLNRKILGIFVLVEDQRLKLEGIRKELRQMLVFPATIYLVHQP